MSMMGGMIVAMAMMSRRVLMLMFDGRGARLMPKSRSAWASWNYIGTTAGIEAASDKPVFVTYWLNRLQNLQTDKQIFVSLNPTTFPREERVHKVIVMGHPQFTPATTQAQLQVNELQGVDGLWFAGAWLGFGFHEDGLRSGLQVRRTSTSDSSSSRWGAGAGRWGGGRGR
jgi:predicted NAD/FAD-binding protein